MILCLLVVIIYCLLFIVMILINIIRVMCDIDDYYYSYSIYVATLYSILNLTSFTACVPTAASALEGVLNNHPRNSAGVIRI